MDKKVDVASLEKSQVKLTITIKAKEVDQAYTKLLNKYAKEAQIKGFRKGKAPVHVLEQKFGDSIAQESAYNLLEDAVKEAVTEVSDENKPLPYSTPTLLDEDKLSFEKNTDLVFSVAYDVLPKVDLKNYKDIEVLVDDSKIKKADVTKEIKKLQDDNALIIEKDGPIANSDIVTCSFHELDADKKPVAGTERKGFVFTVGTKTNFYDLDDKILKMKKGDNKTFHLEYNKDNAPSKDYIDKTIDLYVEIEEVKKKDLPKLDDEFAQDVSEKYKTFKDLENATKEKLNDKLDNIRKNKRLETLLVEILKETTIDLPTSMVNIELEQQWRNTLKQSGLKEEQMLQFLKMQKQTKEDFIGNWRPAAEEHIKKQLVLDAIVKNEKIEADEKELNDRVEKELANVKDEATKNYYKDMIADELKMQKAIDFILNNNKFKVDKEVPFEEYSMIVNQ